MLETFISYLVLYGLKDNIVVFNSAGVIEFQREKMYKSFRYLNALFLVIGIIITSLISYLLYNFVYEKFNLYYINISVNVFIVALYNLVVSNIFHKISSFQYYLYENSFSYGFDVVFMLSVIFTINMNISFVSFIFCILSINIIIFLMNVFMGFYIRSINRGYINIYFRNISARLILFALFSIVLYYASVLVA